MGSIPEFLTKQLASSVVGTLGVDKSGQRLGESIAGVGARAANLGFRELAKRKQVLDTTEAETKQREFDVQLSEEIRNIQKDFRDNPAGGLVQIKIRSKEMSEEFLNDIVSDSVRSLTSIRIGQGISQKTKSLQQWSFNQEVINFGKNLETSVDALGERVSNTTDVFEFLDSIDEAEKLFESGDAGLSAVNAKKFRESGKEFLAEQFLNNLLEKDPVQARDLIENKLFEDFLPDNKVESFELKSAENAFMVEAAVDIKEAVKNVESNPNLTALEKVNTTNKWFNKKAYWDKNLAKLVKEKKEKDTTKIFNGIQDGTVNDITVLRSLTRGFELDYKTQKALEQDFEDQISGKTVESTIAYNHYFNGILDGVNYSDEDIRAFKDVSPDNRLKLLGIRADIIKDPIFKNELYTEAKKLINDLFRAGLLDKFDPNFQDKKVGAKWDFMQSIIARRKVGGQDPLNENTIITEEFNKIRDRINENRGGGITVRSSTPEVTARRKFLLRKILNQTASVEERSELLNLNARR